jgi:transaldolase
VRESYFLRVKATTPTRLWVNHPTVEEIGLALSQGAVGCTTNPAYGGGLLKRAPDEIRPIIAACTAETADDHRAADLVQQRLVARIAGNFLPQYEATGGHAGFVSIQGAPESDTDGGHILAEALEGHALLPNVTPKIPATLPGFYAFEQLVATGIQTIVTEVFSLAQLVHACETYQRVAERTGLRPPFLMSPITGIFNDHLKQVAAAKGIEISTADVDWAGVILARKCQAIVEERSYPVTLLFGGARTMRDFTGLVGAASAATINYSTVDEILAADPEVEDTIHAPVDAAMVSRLDVFEDFRRAIDLDGLEPEEFESFGPVQHFRNNFRAGREALLASVAEALSAAQVGNRR